jgi:hypothetical protein
MDETEAVEALQAAAVEDGNDTSEGAKIAALREQGGEQVDSATPEGGQDDEGTTDEDTFSRLDPNSLPGEVRPYYDSMLADYRRKTQEVAEQRRNYEALEQYGGAEVAAQALEWVAGLQNPDNALALHRELTAALQAQGLSLGDAQEAAAGEVSRRAAEEDADEFEAVRDPRVDTLMQELEAQKAWRAEQEHKQMSVAMAAEYDRQEAQLVRENGYDDEQLEAIYNLSFATGGNLLAADNLYKGIQSQVLSGYLEQKGNVPDAIAGVPATGSAQQPVAATDLNDPNLERAVREFIAQNTQ